jgi:hypothetical protein
MSKRFVSALLFLMLGAVAFAAPAQAGDWISLFDGTSLAGWKASEHPDSFKAEDGKIIGQGPRAHLFFMGNAAAPADFKNFEFEAEVRPRPAPTPASTSTPPFRRRTSPTRAARCRSTTPTATRAAATPN